MGKGKGENPPLKFIHDQFFCQIFIMAFMGAGLTLSGLSAPMDDGESFPYPYFFTGFLLAVILFTNLLSRGIVLYTVKKKGLTKKNILEVLDKTVWGNIIWPWSCRLGMLWCITGSVLTGLGGVNCVANEQKNSTTTVKNKCYYDIEGEHGDMYRGLAIGLVIIHVFSFIFLLLSNCPANTVLEEIKEDPKQNTVAPAQRAAPAQQANAANTTRPTTSQGTPGNAASPKAANGGASGGQQDIEMKALEKQLDERTKELERRERDISERERHFMEVYTIPPPPSYNESMPSS